MAHILYTTDAGIIAPVVFQVLDNLKVKVRGIIYVNIRRAQGGQGLSRSELLSCEQALQGFQGKMPI